MINAAEEICDTKAVYTDFSRLLSLDWESTDRSVRVTRCLMNSSHWNRRRLIFPKKPAVSLA
jgi:hypothetical protein